MGIDPCLADCIGDNIREISADKRGKKMKIATDIEVNGRTVTWYEYEADGGRDCGLCREMTLASPEDAAEFADSLSPRSEARETGYAAAAAGELVSACPYPPGSWDATEWIAGWSAA